MELDNTKIIELKRNIDLMDNLKEDIALEWANKDVVVDILLKHNIDTDLFRNSYASPVIKYFIEVVRGTQKVGTCPVILKFLDYLKDKNISVSELFILCINFRESTVKKMFVYADMNYTLYENISYIFDSNFRGILESYTETLYDANQKIKVLHEVSNTDHLTQLFNRKKFDELLSYELSSSQKDNLSLSMIIFDIDHFKIINDDFGHSVGDEVLIKLSKLISSKLRNSDIISRWGGEEFVILMPLSDEQNATIKAEYFRQVIEEYIFSDEINEIITCSFGVSQCLKNDDIHSFFLRVDKALYKAKNSGRNTVCTL